MSSEHRIPYNEFSNDMEYMPSMDVAWHYVQQDKWKHHKDIIEQKFKDSQKLKNKKEF